MCAIPPASPGVGPPSGRQHFPRYTALTAMGLGLYSFIGIVILIWSLS